MNSLHPLSEQPLILPAFLFALACSMMGACACDCRLANCWWLMQVLSQVFLRMFLNRWRPLALLAVVPIAVLVVFSAHAANVAPTCIIKKQWSATIAVDQHSHFRRNFTADRRGISLHQAHASPLLAGVGPPSSALSVCPGCCASFAGVAS